MRRSSTSSASDFRPARRLLTPLLSFRDAARRGKRTTLLTSTQALVLVACTALLPVVTTSCGARETNVSTNTGNPPVVDQTLVRISGAGGEVVVSGDAGAVDASGDEQVVATVTNLSNDATASATVEGDGSFEVRVAGTLNDEYELTVTTRGASPTTVTLPGSDAPPNGQPDAQSSSPPMTCLERTGGTPNEFGTNGPQPVCGTLNAEARCLAEEVVATVSLGCESNDDCVVSNNWVDCADSCGSGVVVSTQGVSELAAGVAAINQTTCQDFDGQGCIAIPSPCPPPPQLAALCEDGQCVGKYVDYGFECSRAVYLYETATCDDFTDEALCQRDRLIADIQNTCEQDDDCTVAYARPSCSPDNCGGQFAVPKSQATAVADGMTVIAQGICAMSAEANCEYQALPCDAIGYVPSCKAGKCVLNGAL